MQDNPKSYYKNTSTLWLRVEYINYILEIFFKTSDDFISDEV